jgi:hypothetical protein
LRFFVQKINQFNMKKINLLIASFLAFGYGAVGQAILSPSSIISEEYILQDATNEPSYRSKKGGNGGQLAAPGNVIWSENFGSSTSLPSTWTAVVLGGRSGGVGWAWTNQMSQGQYAGGTARMQSTTGANGLMILDADRHNTPTGTGFMDVDAYVEIPLPNLATYPTVILQFEHYWRPFSNAELLLEVTGNGTTWDTIDVGHGVTVNSTSSAFFGLPAGGAYIEKVNLTKSIGGSSNAKIRFHWRGTSHYFWQVDDIKLIEGEYNDIDMNYAYLRPLTDTTRNNYKNFYARIPKSQAALYPLSFSAAYSNAGARLQTNVEVKTRITGPNFHSYNGSSSPRALAIKAVDSNSVLGSPTYLNSGAGNYQIEIFTSSDSNLVRTSNDTIRYPVTVTDTVYARDYITSTSPSSVYYNPSVVQKYEVGVLFEIYKIDTVSSVSFFLPGANGRRANKLGTVSAHIYRAGDYGANGIQTLGTAPIFSSSTLKVKDLGIDPQTAGKWVTVKVAPTTMGVLDTLMPGKYVVTYQADQFFGSDTVFLALEGRDGWQSHYFIRQDQSGTWATWSYSTNKTYIHLNTKSESCPTLNGSVNSTPTTSCGLTNGTATAVDPTNGASPYTYFWLHNSATTQGITGLAAGVYTVEIKDANGCTMRASATVSDAGAPLITNESITNVVCAGDGSGSISFNLTPGTSGSKNYSFTWKDSQGSTVVNATRKDSVLSGVPAGTYTVQVSDGASSPCIVSKTYIMNGPKDTLKILDPVTTGTLSSPSCAGKADGSANLITQGGTPNYTYTWADASAITTASRINLAAGTYNATVTDANNCTDSRSFTLTDPPALMASASVNITAAGAVMTGTANNAQGGGQTFTWKKDGVTVGTGASFTATEPGTYTMTCEDFNGCTANGTWSGASEYKYEWTVGITSTTFRNGLTVFPNPTSGELNIAFGNTGDGLYAVSLKNVLGQELIQRDVEVSGTHTEQLNLKGYNSGVYFLNIENGTSKATYRIVVR